MLPTNVNLTILFADISSSRQIYFALGDDKGHAFIANCLVLLSDITTAHHGKVVKTIGDEVMSVFSKPDLAVEAAVAMQKTITQLSFPDKLNFKPGIHIGLEEGMVVSTENDVFGETVILASRLASQAKIGQILTTGRTFAALTSEHQSTARMLKTTTLKGLASKVGIYEITWELADLTVMMERPQNLTGSLPDFKVVHAGKTIVLNEGHPVISIGRHNSCDICVDETVVSRVHASIELRKKKVYLKDQSTNGTFISFQKDGALFAHLDEVELNDNGIIGLGREVTPESPNALKFFFSRGDYT